MENYDEEMYIQESLNQLCGALKYSRKFCDDLKEIDYHCEDENNEYADVILTQKFADGKKHDVVYRHINVTGNSLLTIIRAVVEKVSH